MRFENSIAHKLYMLALKLEKGVRQNKKIKDIGVFQELAKSQDSLEKDVDLLGVKIEGIEEIIRRKQ